MQTGYVRELCQKAEEWFFDLSRTEQKIVIYRLQALAVQEARSNPSSIARVDRPHNGSCFKIDSFFHISNDKA